jgi:hypothetical protein
LFKVSSLANSSLLSLNKEAILYKILPLLVGSIFDHSLKAFLAASIALSTSSLLASATYAITSLFAGFKTGILSPVELST